MIRKILTGLLFSVFAYSALYAQTDSTRSLFKASSKNFKLQWEEGFTAFAFKNALLTGTSTDFVGVQYKNIMHVSIGADQGTNNIYLNPGYNDPKNYTVVNAHFAYYLNVEPILLPDHLFNITIPVKLSYAANVTGHNSTYNDNFNIAPGVNVMVHLIPNLCLGTGINYRFNMSTIFVSSNIPNLTNDDYTLWLFLRITLK